MADGTLQPPPAERPCRHGRHPAQPSKAHAVCSTSKPFPHPPCWPPRRTRAMSTARRWRQRSTPAAQCGSDAAPPDLHLPESRHDGHLSGAATAPPHPVGARRVAPAPPAAAEEDREREKPPADPSAIARPRRRRGLRPGPVPRRIPDAPPAPRARRAAAGRPFHPSGEPRATTARRHRGRRHRGPRRRRGLQTANRRRRSESSTDGGRSDGGVPPHIIPRVSPPPPRPPPPPCVALAPIPNTGSLPMLNRQ
jgi:hypothetical protein